MARYMVRAEAVTAPTTINPELGGVSLIVQVHDEAGEPVTGLPEHSFRVYSYSSGAFSLEQLVFQSEPLADTGAVHLPGIYVVKPQWGTDPGIPDAVFAVHVRSPREAPEKTTGEAICKLVRGRG